MSSCKIVFSPTGGTEKVLDVLSGELGDKFVKVDISDSKTKFENIILSKEDIALVAVPSYSGRVPAVAVERLSRIRGNGAKAVLVCVYGNRAFEDTLVELYDCVTASDFRVVAAVAAIAEHSIARKYASGRPDMEDAGRLKSFAQAIREKIASEDYSVPELPGNRPYRKPGNLSIVPKVTSGCTECGICAFKCPVGAIDKEHPSKVDKKLCISCMRCVAVCPHNARKIDALHRVAADFMLKKVCHTRKECELFI